MTLGREAGFEPSCRALVEEELEGRYDVEAIAEADELETRRRCDGLFLSVEATADLGTVVLLRVPDIICRQD